MYRMGVTLALFVALAVGLLLAAPLSGASHLYQRLGQVPERVMALARASRWVRSPVAAPPDPRGLDANAGAALERTFRKLRALEETGQGRVAVVQLGASHTAAHLFTDAVRQLMVARFGDGGRGFIAAGKPSPRLVSGGVLRRLTGSWVVLDALHSAPPGQPWGLTGTRAVGQAGSALEIAFCEGCSEAAIFSRLDVHYLAEPEMGELEVLVDGGLVAHLPEAGERPEKPTARVFSVEALGAAHTVEVRNLGPGPATVFGVSSDLLQPGVVWDALGLPGSTIFTLTSYDQDALAAQLAARRPDLYVLFYGTNESGIASLDVQQMRQRYDEAFATLRRAAPDADCLFIGPTDRMRRRPDGGWEEAPSAGRVIPALREVARAHGCAFWSSRAAMGGPRAIGRWLSRKPPLALPDHVHLTPRGYQLLAEMFTRELLAAYAASGSTRAR